MGCAHGKEHPARKDGNKNSGRVKDYHKRKEKSDRTIYSEPTYHIKTEDYKPSPPPPALILPATTPPTINPFTPAPPDSAAGSISNRGDNTTHLSSNKDDNTQDPEDPNKDKVEDTTLERKGSVVRNGVYYSESELAEENNWQPKYWTPDRIGKWVEDTEFPDGMRFPDVYKIIVQSNMTVPRPYRPPANINNNNNHQSAASPPGQRSDPP